jgi:hypothetical protein
MLTARWRYQPLNARQCSNAVRAVETGRLDLGALAEALWVYRLLTPEMKGQDDGFRAQP